MQTHYRALALELTKLGIHLLCLVTNCVLDVLKLIPVPLLCYEWYILPLCGVGLSWNKPILGKDADVFYAGMGSMDEMYL